MFIRTIFLYLLFALTMPSYAQNWQLKDNAEKISFSFDLINHIIIVPIQINGENLDFILDTGVKETLLFGDPDTLNLYNVSKIRFKGIGIDDGLDGLLSLFNTLTIADGKIVDNNHNLYVIPDNSLHLSNHIGVPVNGILGSSFFRNNIVEIDYVKKKITVHRTLDPLEKKLRKYTNMPITIFNDRPYIYADLDMGDKKYEDCKMLVDIGNSDPVMLFASQLPDFVPHDPHIYEYIGKGFSGSIFGKRNRLKEVRMGGFRIRQPISSYPDSNSYQVNRIATGRIGSIGNQIMGRFNIIFDYGKEMIYLKRNKKFSDPFYIDMSGLEVIHDGFTWVESRIYVNAGEESSKNLLAEGRSFKYKIELKPVYLLNNVREGSPAAQSGLKKGDILLKVGGRSVNSLTLDQIRKKLQHKDDLPIKLQVERDGELLVFSFRLKDPIPFLD